MAGVGGENKDLELLLNSKARNYIKERIKEAFDDIYEKENEDFLKGVERHGLHDTLVDICASAFGPESRCYREYGYAFVSSEPLVELGVKNFDVLIYNKIKKHAIFVECKSSPRNPGRQISEAYEAIEYAIENKVYLENELGDEIKKMEFVICVPSPNTDRLVRELERRENEGEIDISSDKLLLVWQVDKFAGQFLQLFTRINSREEPFLSRHLDNNLTKILADGINVDGAEVLVKFYPSSHPLYRGRKIVVNILKTNLANNNDLKEFSKKSVEVFCKSPKSIAHYAFEKLGKNIAEHFIGEGLKLGFIEEIDGQKDMFRLNIDGKKIKTILVNYEKEYEKAFVNNLVKNKSEKAAIEEYRHEFPELFTFE